MPKVGIRELHARCAEVISRAERGERFVVTRHNRPAAVVIGIEEVRDFAFAHAEEFVDLRRAGRRELLEAMPVVTRTPRALALSQAAAVAIARLHHQSRARIELGLRGLAMRAAFGRDPCAGQPAGTVVRQLTEEGEFLRLRSPTHYVACEPMPVADGQRSRLLGVSAVVATQDLDRWMWSGGVEPMSVTFARVRGGRPWHAIPDLT